jgi:hypothetical protein
VDGLVGDLLVALADDDVYPRLATDELGEWGNHDGKAPLLADAGALHQGLVVLVLQPDQAKLVTEVSEHAAGDLVGVLGNVVLHRPAEGEAFPPGNVGELLLDAPQRPLVVHGGVAQRTQVAGDVEDTGEGRAVRQGRHTDVDGPDAKLDRLHGVERAQPRGAVGVQLDIFVAYVREDCRHECPHSLGC